MIKLVYKEYSENILKILILFCVSFALAFIGMFWFAQKRIIYQTVDIYKAYGLSGKVVAFEGEFASNDRVTEDISLIKNLECVEKLENVNIYRDYNVIDSKTDDSSREYGLYLYKLPDDIKYNPYHMIDGRMPEKPNEIMVSSNVNINCGEILKDYIYLYRDNETDNVFKSDVRVPAVTVVGVFDLNNQMPFRFGWTFKGDYDGSRGSSLNDDCGYAFCLDITDSEGEKLESYTTCLSFVVTPKEGFTTSELINQIYSVTGLTAYDLDSYTKLVEEVNEEQLMMFRSVSLILVVILLTLNVSYGVISLSINKRKLSIYYIHGLSWFDTVCIVTFIYLPFILLGSLAGFFLYAYKGAAMLWDFISLNGDCAYMFEPYNILPVSTIIIVAYLMINLSFCIINGRKTPADLIRRE
jgi:hypothetical protein